ncbi:hypothetical protein JTB14_022931 [Gonioctena quinquepunctata]|nr:hypothetical protein JTB14_022931 [Gonioctena quinquepunctata]
MHTQCSFSGTHVKFMFIRVSTPTFFVTVFKHWLFLIIIMSWNLRKPYSSQELQEEVENLSEEEFRDFSDFSDLDPDFNNSNSELGGVSSDESNEDPSSSDNEEVMENEDDENAPDPASNQFEFSWYDYSGNHKTFRFTGNEGLGIGETVVLALTEGLLDEGRTLYTDNFYTSTHLVGTLRRSRKHLPKDVKAEKLKKHEHIGQETNDGIVVSKWKDA